MSPRENATVKATRYLVSGRLVVERVTDREIHARCRGDRGEVYTLGYRRGGWLCSCPARSDCSHLLALWRVTLRPGTGQ